MKGEFLRSISYNIILKFDSNTRAEGQLYTLCTFEYYADFVPFECSRLLFGRALGFDRRLEFEFL